jgi:hypothetical protein
MPNTGCGYMLSIGAGDDAVRCGTMYRGALEPLLCPACARAARTGPFTPGELASLSQVILARCEGCLERPPVFVSPRLCAECMDDYRRDLAIRDAEEGNPGSRCTSACGHCGRCGGA